MGVGHGHLLWTDRRESPRWQSRGVALLITATLFTAAFASMTRLGRPLDDSRFVDAYPRIVFFPPTPRVEAPPKKIERPRPVVPPHVNTPAQTREQPLVAPVPSTVPTSPPPDVVRRDSSAVGRVPGDEILTRPVPTRDAPLSAPAAPSTAARGAPLAPAGVTIGSAPLTAAQRDSIVKNKIASRACRRAQWRARGTHWQRKRSAAWHAERRRQHSVPTVQLRPIGGRAKAQRGDRRRQSVAASAAAGPCFGTDRFDPGRLAPSGLAGLGATRHTALNRDLCPSPRPLRSRDLCDLCGQIVSAVEPRRSQRSAEEL